MKGYYRQYYVPKNIPEWFTLMKKNSLLSGTEVTKLFGFSSIGVIHRGITEGNFPQPDIMYEGLNRSGWKDRAYWSKVTIMKEIVRRKKANKEKENTSCK